MDLLFMAAIAIGCFWIGLIVGVNVGESWAASGGTRNEDKD